MSGISVRNLRLFRGLCGTDCLKNVILLTNWWGDVKPGVGEQREMELMNDDKFWKPVLDKGATTLRHDRTRSNAQDILRHLINNIPKALLIQEQLVDEKMKIVETDAGSFLKGALEKQAIEHKREMDTLRTEMEEAMREKDEATRKELEGELQDLTDKVKRLQESMTNLGKELMDERNSKELLERRNKATAKAIAEAHRELHSYTSSKMTLNFHSLR